MEEKRKDDEEDDEEDDSKNNPSRSCEEDKPKKAFYFDRLKPRMSNIPDSTTTSFKRKSRSEDPLSAKKPKKTKEEYLKLRTLVPALNEREDLSKVEIIEETIRYIDALHHQLAAKRSIVNNNSSPNSDNSQSGNGDSPSTSSAPLQSLDVDHRSGRRSSSTTSSSSSRSSPQDVKAAVENIQAMFTAYLEQNEQL